MGSEMCIRDRRPWVNAPDYWGTHDALLEAIKIALDEADMSVPFPQMDVHFHQEAQQTS